MTQLARCCCRLLSSHPSLTDRAQHYWFSAPPQPIVLNCVLTVRNWTSSLCICAFLLMCAANAATELVQLCWARCMYMRPLHTGRCICGGKLGKSTKAAKYRHHLRAVVWKSHSWVIQKSCPVHLIICWLQKIRFMFLLVFWLKKEKQKSSEILSVRTLLMTFSLNVMSYFLSVWEAQVSGTDHELYTSKGKVNVSVPAVWLFLFFKHAL